MKNQSINLCKAIACLLVVFIHCPFPGGVGEYVVAFGRGAVPFFALVTGYYSYFSDSERRLEVAKLRLKNIINLTINSVLICVGVNSIASLIGGGGILTWLLPHLNIKTVVLFVLFNRASLFSMAIWYLFALIYVYVIWIFFQIKRSKVILYCMVPLLLIGNIVITEILEIAWYVAGNFLFTILPFFLIGSWVHEKNLITLRMARYGIIISIFMIIFEIRLFGASFMYIGTIMCSVSLLVLAIAYPIKENCCWIVKWICLFGDRLSMPVFVIHCGIMQIIISLEEKYNYFVSNWILPVVVLICSAFIAIVFLNMKRLVVLIKGKGV